MFLLGMFLLGMFVGVIIIFFMAGCHEAGVEEGEKKCKEKCGCK